MDTEMNTHFDDFEGKSARTGRCGRAAFLLDARQYFSALAESIRQAERSVLIVGWDIDSRILLDPENRDERLCDLLNSVVEQRPGLHIHILIWDFPMAYSLDREPLQLINFTRKTHGNIHFHLDSELPIDSSHHQKIVVVDDRVAFVGGMDLTAARWDTPEHRARDNRRTRPDGNSYGPYHDVQMVVDGELAAILGDVARRRWLWATDNTLPPPQGAENDPWPASVEPQLRDETGSVILTLPRYKGREEIRDVESAYLRELKQARSVVYIENQYLTSSTIRQALAARLGDENGPEIVIVLPRMNSGLLEQLVMEPLQSDILDSLYALDKHGKLGVYCAFATDDDNVPVTVHAKVMIVDDAFITVGSANLNERSMGLDSECNIVMRPKDEGGAVRAFRHRLIAHHLGVDTEEYANMESKHRGMLKAVESLRREHGGLRPEADSRNGNGLPVDPEMARALDSSHPGIYDAIMDEYGSDDSSRASFSRFIGFGAMLTVFVVLALAWRFTPLSDYATADTLLHWAATVRQLPFAPAFAVLAFVLGGLIMFPAMLLIVLTASIFEPVPAFAISLTGSLASALVVYGIGSMLGREAVRKVAGSKIHTISRQLGRHGLASVLVVRIVPVAPYSVINLIAGASHINVGVFLLGTFLGMVPGIIGMTLFGGQLMNALRDPGPGTLAILAVIVLLVVGLGALIRRRLRRLHQDREHAPEPEEPSS
jgi:phosphatidylserine/phosphatidylglycerophosphate/cardiolipin synthase-like enzyme/uncharacterized membrane protein YdjX (TVP38/TMEM64 family)